MVARLVNAVNENSDELPGWLGWLMLLMRIVTNSDKESWGKDD